MPPKPIGLRLRCAGFHPCESVAQILFLFLQRIQPLRHKKVLKTLQIGIIGLDTSHAVVFTDLLNSSTHPHHVPGGKVVVAFPGGSPDFELSRSRVRGFTEKLRDQFGVRMLDSPEAVAEECDALLLESVDGRAHPEQFRRIARFGKPVFVDKPFAVSSAEARRMIALAKKSKVPLMSCSALRYAEGLAQALSDESKGAVIGADFYGPMALETTQPGLFWYGIHMVEMLFATLGRGCQHVTATTNRDHDLIVGVWSDGRIGTVRGNRKGNGVFGGVIHREKGSQHVDVYANPKPYYASLLEQIMKMFETGKPPLDATETLEIVRLIEAANASRATDKKMRFVASLPKNKPTATREHPGSLIPYRFRVPPSVHN